MLLITACAGSTDSLLDPATTHSYRVGYPEVKARIASFFDDEGRPVIDLNVEMPYSSLIFVTRDGQRLARVRVEAYFRTDDVQKDLVKTISEEITAVVDDNTTEFALFYERREQIPPGDYEIELRVTDLTSDKVTPSRLNTSVPDPDTGLSSISDIRVTQNIQNNEQVISSFLIPQRSDSLKFSFYVTRPDESVPVTVDMKLLRIRADMDYPRPISHLPLPVGSLAYRGVDYSSLTEIESRERELDIETGSILFEFQDAFPERGIYRFEIVMNTVDADGNEKSIRRFRDFTAVSPNFPEIKSAREMAKPLYYLMTRREFSSIMEIEQPDSLRRAFEDFWLSNIKDRTRARNVIELYYTRVEEANRAFSTFREGWMTDMGMVYILLGPPAQIENRVESMYWYYSYNRMDPRSVIRFDRARIQSASFPFEHYVLVRQRFYNELEHTAIYEWLSGRVLDRRPF